MTQSAPHHSPSKYLRLLAKIGLTLAAFWFVFHDVDFAALSDMLKRQDHLLTALAALCIVAQILLWGVRWRLILMRLAQSAHVATLSEMLKISYIGAFFNCCLPGTVGGDVIRVWLAKSEHVSLSLSIHSVVIDRIIALVALVVLVLIMLPVLGKNAGIDPAIAWTVAIVAGLAGLWLLFNIERPLSKFTHIPLIRWLLYFIASLRLLLARKRSALAVLLYALAGHVSFCLCGYMLAKSLGVDLSVMQAIAFIPPVLLAITLPVSIGGWGVREAGMVGMLGMIGIPQAQALMLSIQLGLMSVILTLPAGLLWLAYRRRSPKPPSLTMVPQ
jgi:uncharacterized protein (TIRG00374 family)